MRQKKVALVVGGTGMAGCEVIPLLINEFGSEWEQVILFTSSTGNPQMFNTSRPCLVMSGASLDDKRSLVDGLKKLQAKVTHVFWFVDANKPPSIPFLVPIRIILHSATIVKPLVHLCLRFAPTFALDALYGTLAYAAGSGSNPTTQRWLENMIGALIEVGSPLENFCLGTGGKHYGMHLGPVPFEGYQCPFIEDAMKAPGSLSYFDQEEILIRKSQEFNFSFNVLRPSFIIGLSPKMHGQTTQSLGLVIAVYATMMKANGLPLIFPGNEAAWNAKMQLTTSEDIAKVGVWAACNKVSRNQAYNVISSIPFSWSDGTWHSIAMYFGIKAVSPSKSVSGFSCTSTLGARCHEIWEEIKAQYGLRKEMSFNEVFNYEFFDKSFTPSWDATFSTEKLLSHGYQVETIRADMVMVEFFSQLVKQRLIPDPKIMSSLRSLTDLKSISYSNVNKSIENVKQLGEVEVSDSKLLWVLKYLCFLSFIFLLQLIQIFIALT